MKARIGIGILVAAILLSGGLYVWAIPPSPPGSGSGGVSTYADVVVVFGGGSCSGYLKSDGTCDTPSSGLTAGGTPTNHQWAGWTDATTLKGFSVTASKPVCTDASGDPGVCAGTEGVWQIYDPILAAIAALTTTEGSIVYFSGADTPVVLAKGVAYQRLRMNAAATAPEWEYPQDIITTIASGVTMTKAQFCGATIRATATETLTYPTVTADMVGCKTKYRVIGAYTLSIDVPVAVTTTLNGQAITAGNKIANSGFSGEEIELTIVSTTSIETGSPSGVWIDSGA